MVKITSSLVLTVALTAPTISASSFITLQPRQFPLHPNKTICDTLCTKLWAAVTSIDYCWQPYEFNKQIPVSTADATDLSNIYNTYAKVNCNAPCTDANKPFIPELRESCKDPYVYVITTKDSVPYYVPAAALIADYLCYLLTEDGNYCYGNLMASLYKSFTSKTTVDPVKYKTPYAPTTIHPEEVRRVCGMHSWRRDQPTLITVEAESTSTAVTFPTSVVLSITADSHDGLPVTTIKAAAGMSTTLPAHCSGSLCLMIRGGAGQLFAAVVVAVAMF
ncbi:hypothetical protein BC829DRAFT_384400 [Chytridium lagenaria]|nr:hypothetical protein BC829DRAFT_384400 [Chytridium lagenaria]